MTLLARLDQFRNLIETEIRKEKFGSQPESLYEPIRYLMAIGGKRLRPLLCLLAYSIYKKNITKVVPYAVAVEVFHNFTLMHDDIMDKSPLRRGKRTVHEKWDLNTAILSGDVMLVKVYEKFARLDAITLKEVLTAFNACAVAVCEGQQMDMDFERTQTVRESDYLRMISLKTGVLLGFSLELGAILAGADKRERKALRDFGVRIGAGFQLKDDLLDVYGDPAKVGKKSGRDIVANKKTYLLIHALEKSSGAQKTRLRRWLNANDFAEEEKINAVKAIYDEVGVREETQNKIESEFNFAFRQLNKIKGDIKKIKLLRDFTTALIARQS